MVSFIPGNLILYRESGSELPLWPSIYCTDDVAPNAFLRTRPVGYFHLVLKLAEVVDTTHLRWAMTTELNHYDPFAASQEMRDSTLGLAEAYDVADQTLESGLDLDHWRTALAFHSDNGNNGNNLTVIDSDDDDSSDNEDDVRLAKDISRADHRAQGAPQFLMQPSARLERESRRYGSSSQLIDFTTSPPLSISDDELRLPPRIRSYGDTISPTLTPSSTLQARIDGYSSQSTKRTESVPPASSDDELPSPHPKNKTSVDQHSISGAGQLRRNSFLQRPPSTTLPSKLFTDRSVYSSQSKSLTLGRTPQLSTQKASKEVSASLSASQLFLRDGLRGPASSLPIDDAIEEDLDESNQFVQIFVGPEVDPQEDPEVDPERKRHRFKVLKHYIWDRSYFRNALSARNHFTPMGENAWELQHPRLEDIHPDDFRLVVEFLESGDFGHRHPQGEEQVAETLAHCMSAWTAAEKLNMDDLLDHIVNKIKSTADDWNMHSMMVFACFVWQRQSSDYETEAHDQMKSLLSAYIAEHFFDYVEAEELRSEFLDRLKQAPDLQTAVFEKLAGQNRQAQLAEHDEEDTVDLYE